MATYRIGIGSFNLKDGAVGIGTESSGLGNLKVEGTYKTTDLDVTGVSTFTRYAGFAADNINIANRDVSLTGEHQTTGDIVVGVNSTFTVSVGATVDVGTVPSVSIGTHFSPPTGDINDRPEVPVEGTVRFNKDLNTLEFYNGVDWRQFTVSGARGRAVISQGYQPSYYPQMYDYITITTLGNSQYFGDITEAVRDKLACGSTNRGIFGGGITSGNSKQDTIEYITIPSQGNGIDFGNLTAGGGHGAAASSETRGVFGGGYRPALSNVIDYIEIGTLGNALDFGDLQLATGYGGAAGSGVRGFFCGGSYNAPNDLASDRIEYVTFASKGNGIDFGGLTNGRFRPSACATNLFVFTTGSNAGNSGQIVGIDKTNSISLGKSVNFGDLPWDIAMHFSTTNPTRAVIGGGQGAGTSPAFQQNSIQYITVSTSGNSMDFGDLTLPTVFCSATSDSHGGLGGY